MKITREDWRFIVLVLWLVANTYLVASGHLQLSSDVLRIDSQMVAKSCPALHH